MDLARIAGLLGAGMVVVLLILGLGGGPLGLAADPVRPALLGLAAIGLTWPAVVLGLVGRRRAAERDAAREAGASPSE